jgi:hypothetical protein
MLPWALSPFVLPSDCVLFCTFLYKQSGYFWRYEFQAPLRLMHRIAPMRRMFRVISLWGTISKIDSFAALLLKESCPRGKACFSSKISTFAHTFQGNAEKRIFRRFEDSWIFDGLSISPLCSSVFFCVLLCSLASFSVFNCYCYYRTVDSLLCCPLTPISSRIPRPAKCESLPYGGHFLTFQRHTRKTVETMKTELL